MKVFICEFILLQIRDSPAQIEFFYPLIHNLLIVNHLIDTPSYLSLIIYNLLIRNLLIDNLLVYNLLIDNLLVDKKGVDKEVVDKEVVDKKGVDKEVVNKEVVDKGVKKFDLGRTISDLE